MRSTRRTRRAALLAVAAAALVAGCGSSGSGKSGSAPSTSGTPGGPAGATLRTVHDPELGTIVTDSAGFTLYRFDQDGTNPPESYCNGNCATIWPPEQANGNVTAKGVDSTLVGTVARSDGTKQVAINGSPVYRFSMDTKPGDTKGEGVAGTWFAVTPTGGRAMPSGGSAPGSPGPANPTPMPSTPGY
ncbi:hypothetical protein [Kitasatospora cathayae]|uniref:Lipoprotein n=1 Tax=Kitasatospora cathayae TaxID=3004092 RepID=A0ABY7QB02_9ACTN|nr:hypothetical protein [Kitasatospora sp. HUAS 3-15]WBP89711.1 hypothetical protein O1G21_30250 [Kitasatospora sp. HUAS 3-15]